MTLQTYELANPVLIESQVAQFDELGYLILPSFLPADLAAGQAVLATHAAAWP